MDLNGQQKLEQEAFIKAIQDDAYDQATHMAYADWLMEEGMDTEAEWERNWTKERQESEDFLRDLAGKMGKTCINYGRTYDWGERREVEEPIWVDITLEDVVQAGYDYFKGDWFTQQGSENARNMMFDEELRKAYWHHWSVYTGKQPPRPGEINEWDDEYPSPFSCSC